MKIDSHLLCLEVLFLQLWMCAVAFAKHDVSAETRLLEQLASADSDTKINAAVEIGRIFQTQKGLPPQVYSRILKMLAPESPQAEREGAAWALGEIRYVEPSVQALMKKYEVEAIHDGNIALSTILMHSLREVAEVLPVKKQEKCQEIFRSLK